MMIQTILPVFLLIAVGAGLQRTGFFVATLARDLSQLVYWVGIPCLLFDKISKTVLDWSPVMRILLIFWVVTGGTVLLGWITARWVGLSRRSTAAFVQACFRGNTGFIGLPVIFYVGASLFGKESGHVYSLAVLTLAVTAPLFNSLAVVLMVGGQRDENQIQGRSLLWLIVSNPLILAALCGICFATMRWQLPFFLMRTIQSLSQMTIPLALLSMGAVFIQVPLRGSLLYPCIASVIKVVITPIVGLFLGRMYGLTPAEMCVVLVYLATPTAVVSYVMVEQFQGDRVLAVNSVVLSTLLSVVTLPVILGLM